MIIISSMRPLSDDESWKKHQLMAFRSWLVLKAEIVLFGKRESELESRGVSFVESEQFPRIKSMLQELAKHKTQIGAIVNGDILLTTGLRKIENLLRLGKFKAAFSRRWHFDSSLPWEKAQLQSTLTNIDGQEDKGQDCFISTARVWQAMAQQMDNKWRIGHAGWDGALNYAIRDYCTNERCLNFTNLRMVYHPHHQGRRMPYAQEIANV